MTKEDKTNNEKSFNAAHDKLNALELKCEEYLNGWKRERADFLNYKKEEMERIGQLVKYANEEIILKLLPILDNFCLAKSHVPADFANTGNSQKNSWIEGFLQIEKQLSDFLAKEGIEHIEVMGKQFDPNLMDAMAEVATEETEAANETKATSETKETMTTGTVAEEVQRGYTLHGKLIRPAKVKISK